MHYLSFVVLLIIHIKDPVNGTVKIHTFTKGNSVARNTKQTFICGSICSRDNACSGFKGDSNASCQLLSSNDNDYLCSLETDEACYSKNNFIQVRLIYELLQFTYDFIPLSHHSFSLKCEFEIF